MSSSVIELRQLAPRAAGKSFAEVVNSCKSVISSDDLVFVPTTPQKYRRRSQERSVQPPEEDGGGGDFLGVSMHDWSVGSVV